MFYETCKTKIWWMRNTTNDAGKEMTLAYGEKMKSEMTLFSLGNGTYVGTKMGKTTHLGKIK
jgi:hypothetical protein